MKAKDIGMRHSSWGLPPALNYRTLGWCRGRIIETWRWKVQWQFRGEMTRQMHRLLQKISTCNDPLSISPSLNQKIADNNTVKRIKETYIFLWYWFSDKVEKAWLVIVVRHAPVKNMVRVIGCRTTFAVKELGMKEDLLNYWFFWFKASS